MFYFDCIPVLDDLQHGQGMDSRIDYAKPLHGSLITWLNDSRGARAENSTPENKNSDPFKAFHMGKSDQ